MPSSPRSDHEPAGERLDQADDQADEQAGQVSEVSGLQASGREPPGDATAGYPDETAESGEAQEGTAGPNAPPRHQPPEPTNESSR